MSNEPIRIVLEVYGGDVRVVDSEPKAEVVHTAKRPKASGPKRMGRQPADGRRDWVCPFDGVDYANNTSLRRHLENEHGIVGTLDDVYGRVCPLDGQEVPVGKRGWHEHVQKHGVKNVSRAFVKAINKGDRYGIVAATLGIEAAAPVAA